ncbi:MAG: hypothetical protein O6837_07825, partial [Deltaproteobacteria bacterium]|nr:hypothetical protein [Deltaproteobacteria bacterium]
MNRILSKSGHVFVFMIVLAMLALGHTVTAGELEEAAKKEGRIRLVFFPSHVPLAKAFEAKYGIKVEGTFVGAPPILRKVSQESDAGIFAIDVFTTSPGPTGSKLNKWALPYTPEGFEKVAKAKKALPAGWNQTPVLKLEIGVAYNRDLVSAQQVPRS